MVPFGLPLCQNHEYDAYKEAHNKTKTFRPECSTLECACVFVFT